MTSTEANSSSPFSQEASIDSRLKSRLGGLTMPNKTVSVLGLAVVLISFGAESAKPL
jgi:hypothetical protein